MVWSPVVIEDGLVAVVVDVVPPPNRSKKREVPVVRVPRYRATSSVVKVRSHV
jgi:hypothetical protein